MKATWEVLPFPDGSADIRAEWRAEWGRRSGWRVHLRSRKEAEEIVAECQSLTAAGMDPGEAIRRIRQERGQR